jgi:drug/metabolite transporter (DMT)-like permease
VYSLRGGDGSALARTAGNFSRAALLCLPLAAAGLAAGHADPGGVALALLSGALTSGLGYAVWYRALPGLSPIQAASVQLTVPLIATAGAALALSETVTTRFVLSGFFLLGGVAMTILARRSR